MAVGFAKILKERLQEPRLYEGAIDMLANMAQKDSEVGLRDQLRAEGAPTMFSSVALLSQAEQAEVASTLSDMLRKREDTTRRPKGDVEAARESMAGMDLRGHARIGMPKGTRGKSAMDEVREFVRRVDQSVHGDFMARSDALEGTYDAVRGAIAEVLEPALNLEAAHRPHETYEQKKDLAKWVSAQLRRFGLAVQCPRTGKPCRFMANPGGQPGVGRFLLEYTDETGRRQHPFTSVALPQMSLMPDDLSRASYADQHRRR
jgi:hypothetical protein